MYAYLQLLDGREYRLLPDGAVWVDGEPSALHLNVAGGFRCAANGVSALCRLLAIAGVELVADFGMSSVW